MWTYGEEKEEIIHIKEEKETLERTVWLLDWLTNWLICLNDNYIWDAVCSVICWSNFHIHTNMSEIKSLEAKQLFNKSKHSERQNSELKSRTLNFNAKILNWHQDYNEKGEDVVGLTYEHMTHMCGCGEPKVGYGRTKLWIWSDKLVDVMRQRCGRSKT